MEHLECRRAGSIVILVDLIYSPDDNGYYLEKSTLPDGGGEVTLHSKIYPNRGEALREYRTNTVAWERM